LLAREPTAGRSGIHVCLPGLQSSRSRSPAVSPTPKGRLRASRSPSVLCARRQEKAAAGGSDQRRLLTHYSRGDVSAIGSRLLAGGLRIGWLRPETVSLSQHADYGRIGVGSSVLKLEPLDIPGSAPVPRRCLLQAPSRQGSLFWLCRLSPFCIGHTQHSL
jgi:hypothetical protein